MTVRVELACISLERGLVKVASTCDTRAGREPGAQPKAQSGSAMHLRR